MRLALLIAAAIALPAAAAGQDPGPQRIPSAPRYPPAQWVRSDELIAMPQARIAFPTTPAGLNILRTGEFSHQGEGLDNSVEYISQDGKVWATAYLFYPGLAHTGLSAFATDAAMTSATNGSVKLESSQVVAAAGKHGAAIRRDYSGYLNSTSTSAAFVKAGRWMIAFRVSGPPDRRTEIDAAMQSFLGQTRIGPASPAHPALPLEVADCAKSVGGRGARLLPDPADASLAAIGFLATFDGGGIEADDKDKGGLAFLESRVPPKMCLSSRLSVGTSRIPVLRGEDGPSRSVDGRTVLVAVLSDSGDYLEVVHAANLKRYVLLRHSIGGTAVLGSFDGVPSDDQVRAVIVERDNPAGRVRVPVRLHPEKEPEMYLPTLQATTGKPST